MERLMHGVNIVSSISACTRLDLGSTLLVEPAIASKL